jgi:hypothetical protein
MDYEKSLAELYAERSRLAGSLPTDRSAQLGTAQDDLARVDQDWRDLYDGAGRWAGHAAGQAARATREAAVEYQRTQERARGPGLGPWSRHKAKRELKKAGARFDQAHVAWRQWGEPHARSFEARRQHLDADVTRLAQAQRERETFLEGHPTSSPAWPSWSAILAYKNNWTPPGTGNSCSSVSNNASSTVSSATASTVAPTSA